MTAIIHSSALRGFYGVPVRVEVDIRPGLPSLHIVGMGSKSISEAKDRVKSGIKNSNLNYPAQKITVNLAPAEIPKDGTHLDVPIALGILVASGQLKATDTHNRLFIGELSLDGSIRPVRGSIISAELASSQGHTHIFLPTENAPQSALLSSIKPVGVSTLQELYLTLKGMKNPRTAESIKIKTPESQPLIDAIHGHHQAKRALTIAAAGKHNILLSGVPGSGKTLLAKALHSLLPQLNEQHIIAATKIHTLNKGSSCDTIITSPPFRSPHHSTTRSALIGGGVLSSPGEISLAHAGVLLLDELPEFQKSTLEALRQPLEDKYINLSHHHAKTTYPCDTIVVATMNLCPCGNTGNTKQPCTCTQRAIASYRQKISEPLLDRFDIKLSIKKENFEHIFHSQSMQEKQHLYLREIVKNAQILQEKRFNSCVINNGNATPSHIDTLFRITPEARRLALRAAKKLDISTRGYYRCLRLARTIADLENSPTVTAAHAAEAFQFRGT